MIQEAFGCCARNVLQTNHRAARHRHIPDGLHNQSYDQIVGRDTGGVLQLALENNYVQGIFVQDHCCAYGQCDPVTQQPRRVQTPIFQNSSLDISRGRRIDTTDGP